MTQRSEAELRAELERVDGEIAELRASAAEIRQQVGGRSDGTVEPEETAATIGSAEELEAIADTLVARRDEVARQLGAV
jgi:F0F1-type ATP synthase membrane subunit b/b'